jgi:hypothetical protein
MRENYLSHDIFVVDVIYRTIVDVAIECISKVFTSNPNSICLSFANSEIFCNKQRCYFRKKDIGKEIT